MAVRYVEDEASADQNHFYEEEELPPSYEQLLILCIDTSNSMRNDQSNRRPGHTRSHEVFRALFEPRGLFDSLSSSELRRSFWTMGIGFDVDAVELWPPLPVVNDTGIPIRFDYARLEDWQELMRWGPRTSIASALVAASVAAQAWLLQDRDTRFVTIAVISDGGDNDPDNSCLEIADSIKSSAERVSLGAMGGTRPRVVVATAAYGQPGQEGTNWKLLKDIASHPREFHRQVPAGEQLRDFLIASVTIQLHLP